MGSVLGVAVFGSITASVFASRMADLAHGPGRPAGSLGAAAALAHRADGAAVLHAAASAFVTGADQAVLAGTIATLAGVLIALRTLRSRRAPRQAPVAAEVPARPEILVPADVTVSAEMVRD